MKVRYIDKPEITGDATNFNMQSLTEVIVHFEDGSADSEYASHLEVQLGDDSWMPMVEAFARHVLVVNNHNEYFREAQNDIEANRGWFDD